MQESEKKLNTKRATASQDEVERIEVYAAAVPDAANSL